MQGQHPHPHAPPTAHLSDPYTPLFCAATMTITPEARALRPRLTQEPNDTATGLHGGSGCHHDDDTSRHAATA